MVAGYVGRSKVAEVRGKEFEEETVYCVSDGDGSKFFWVQVAIFLGDEVKVCSAEIIRDRGVVGDDVIREG